MENGYRELENPLEELKEYDATVTEYYDLRDANRREMPLQNKCLQNTIRLGLKRGNARCIKSTRLPNRRIKKRQEIVGTTISLSLFVLLNVNESSTDCFMLSIERTFLYDGLGHQYACYSCWDGNAAFLLNCVHQFCVGLIGIHV